MDFQFQRSCIDRIILIYLTLYESPQDISQKVIDNTTVSLVNTDYHIDVHLGALAMVVSLVPFCIFSAQVAHVMA